MMIVKDGKTVRLSVAGIREVTLSGWSSRGLLELHVRVFLLIYPSPCCGTLPHMRPSGNDKNSVVVLCLVLAWVAPTRLTCGLWVVYRPPCCNAPSGHKW